MFKKRHEIKVKMKVIKNTNFKRNVTEMYTLRICNKMYFIRSKLYFWNNVIGIY